ncbi:arylesterase [Thalassococcus sp. CAU 1522]|uniref:Arylesterase n=1 Tax=Thalassococcus arenae TaxID=2851652 RepID=A0ABS6N5J9_9RHOB|nr:arylesterase [Thalassococcus arenae]MBV2359287.1 arylesterase [Thalassococcus arenae]
MLRAFTYGAWGALSKAIVLTGVLAVAPAAAEPVEIVALGDSLTEGYGLPIQDGLVPQLTEWLAARGHDVRVVNAGVSGDTTAGGLSRAAWSLGPGTDAMIVALGGNDLLRGIDPAFSRRNLDGILQVAQEAGVEVLLVGMQAPGNYGPDYKAAFDAMYPELAERYDALLVPSFFDGLREPGAEPAAPADLARFMQADGIHPNREGVARIVAALGPAVERLIDRAAAD